MLENVVSEENEAYLMGTPCRNKHGFSRPLVDPIANDATFFVQLLAEIRIKVIKLVVDRIIERGVPREGRSQKIADFIGILASEDIPCGDAWRTIGLW